MSDDLDSITVDSLPKLTYTFIVYLHNYASFSYTIEEEYLHC